MCVSVCCCRRMILQMKLCNTSPKAVCSPPNIYWENKMHAVLFALVYWLNNLSHFIVGCFILFCGSPQPYRASLVAQTVKNLPPVQETWVWSLGQEDPLEKGMATCSSVLAWRIPWTQEPGGLFSLWGSWRIRHDWVTNHSLSSPTAWWREHGLHHGLPSSNSDSAASQSWVPGLNT